MVAYKGDKARCKKQCNPKKPTKWVQNMCTRALVSCFVYDYIFFEAARTFIGREFDEDETGSLESAGLVIIALAKTKNIDEPVLCFDNYFTTFTILKMLRGKYNIYALGTIQKNRIQKIDIKFTKSVELVDQENHSYLVNRLDSREVLVCSNCVGTEPMQSTYRYDRVLRLHITINCPVKEYNRTIS